jgi:hypothetical protein
VLISAFREDQSVKLVCVALPEGGKGRQRQNSDRYQDRSERLKDIYSHFEDIAATARRNQAPRGIHCSV